MKTSSYLTTLLFAAGFLFFDSCSKEPDVIPIPPDPEPKIYKIPVVVHIIHHGEPVGEGFNLSDEQIEGQIRIINEDFRRKEGTRGFNTHPDGGDARIEFVLAKTAPDGTATDGIVRVNADTVENPVETNSLFDYYAYYSYWNPESYLNIWTMPLDESLRDIFLGKGTGPETDLPGAELLLRGEPLQAEGILINAAHFGESDIDSEHNLGRTLTHEIGHYLGLLHTWGGGDCVFNDYCEDTPPVAGPVGGCPAAFPSGCNGQAAMIGNYMNYTYDRCMNIFTKDQIARMHYVLENSPRRKSLVNSAGLENELLD